MNAHILVAEDSRDVRQMVSAFLQTAGYRVSEVANIPEAMDVIRADPPDLIVLDLTLLDDPFGGLSDGFSLLYLLKQNCSNATFRVVIYTGDDSPTLPARAKAAGVAEVVYKGSPPHELMAAIRRTLGELVAEPPRFGTTG